MKKRSIEKVLLVVFLGICLSIVAISQKTEDPSVLLRSAIEKEEVDGNLQAAIDIYQQIIEKFGDKSAVAAQAQFRIGRCYEKMGKREALEAYEKVIKNYPQQYEEVKAAKKRISQLTKALVKDFSKPKFRKIRIPANPENGVLSPDGKRFAFISQKSVWTVPIPGKVQSDLAGEPIRLTEPLGTWNLGNTMAWSGDGKWIAFNAQDEGEKIAIYVVSSEGGQPKKIPATLFRKGRPYDYRISLSFDGQVLAFVSKDVDLPEAKSGEKYPSFLYTTPVNGGTINRLTKTWSSQPAFSPDGSRISYLKSTFLEKAKVQWDLFVINNDGSDPIKLTTFPGRGRGPVWSPDGRKIAVNHEPGRGSSSKEIWIVTLTKDGKASGAPAKIKLPLESFSIISGWTTDNKIGLLMANPFHHAIYTVPESGGKATQVTPDVSDSWACYPKWSPDGKTLYFRWGFGNIASVVAEGGKPYIVHNQEKTKIVEGIPGAGNGLSPDGKKIVFMAYKKDTRPLEVNIWTVPVEGGKPTQVTKSPTQDRYPSWSPDGKFIAFSRYEQTSKDEYEMNIFLTPSEGGEVRKLTSKSNRVALASIDWSPDGKYIAYFSRDKTLNIIPVDGSKHRVLTEVGNVREHSSLSWSPDGNELAFTSNGHLMVVAVDSGELREVETGVLKKGVQDFEIDWSPDGKKFVFSAGYGGEEELWLMEDFLPKTKDKK